MLDVTVECVRWMVFLCVYLSVCVWMSMCVCVCFFALSYRQAGICPPLSIQQFPCQELTRQLPSSQVPGLPLFTCRVWPVPQGFPFPTATTEKPGTGAESCVLLELAM